MTTTPHIFQVPESLPQGFHLHRRGSRWTPEDDALLRSMAASGYSIAFMCITLRRDIGGITNRLVKLGLAHFDDGFYVQTTPNNAPTTKQNIMNPTATIETKTFILGRDASTMTDIEIFNLIAKTEAELCRLKGIQTKSFKLDAYIKKLGHDLCQLAAYVDDRAEGEN